MIDRPLDSSPTRTRRSGWTTALSLTLLALGGHLLYLSLFRRYPAPLGAMLPGFFWSTVLVFAVLCLRVLLASDGERRARGAGWLDPERWLDGMTKPDLVLAAFFLSAFYLLQEHGGRVGNDGTMFFVNVRSLVMDFDLDLTNEFEEFVPEKFHVPSIVGGSKPRPGNELGASLFWIPFFVLAHLLVKAGGLLGSSIPANGYSYPYINAVCLGSLLWAFAGVVLSHRVARRYFDSTLSAWSAGLLWFASPLIWYTVQEPAMSHAVSMAAVAAFLTCWLSARNDTGLVGWSMVALTAGLMISVQRYNVMYLMAPALTLGGIMLGGSSPRGPGDVARLLKRLVIVVAILLAATLPLWLYNLYMEGTLIGHGDLPHNSLSDWRRPHVVEFLFSSNHGLFSWTPAISFSILGLFLFFTKERRLTAILIVTLGFGVYLLSSSWNWFAGYSFGSRRLTEAYPLFLIGFCAFIDWVRRSPRLLTVGLASLLVLWNFILAGQLRRGEIPPIGTFAFSKTAARGAEKLYERVGHPPSFPANWLFAWRYSVRPDQFDRLYGDPAYHNLVVNVGAEDDDRFIAKGWAIPERMPDGRTFRWSDGAESSLLVPLFSPYPYVLRLVGEPVRLPSPEPLRISVLVNDRPAGMITITSEAPSRELVVPRDFWKTGVNEVLLRYSRTARADEVYGGSDPRELALRLERFELQIDREASPL